MATKNTLTNLIVLLLFIRCTPPPQIQWYETLAEAICYRVHIACCGNSNDKKDDFFIKNYGLDEEQCKKIQANLLLTTYLINKSSNAISHDGKQSRCEANLLTSKCYPQTKFINEQCIQDIWQGKKNKGEQCEQNIQCADHMVCNCLNLSTSCIKTCNPPNNIDESCNNQNTCDFNQKLFCSINNTTKQGSCKQRKEEGMHCESDIECQIGLLCKNNQCVIGKCYNL